MSFITKISTFLILSVTLFSCQKVINVDLNSTDPRIVIEGGITDEAGPYEVRVTHTVNFNQPNVFPGVSGANLKLTDNAGNAEILTEVSPGIYHTATIKGVPGRTYTLSVTSAGKTYIASSTMPASVTMDSLHLKRGLFIGELNVEAYFPDPSGIKNWYRFVETRNDSVRKDIYIASDMLRDGQRLHETIFTNTTNNDTLRAGDSVTIALQAIDEPVFEYFRTLQQIVSGGDPGTAPANPLSNFNNGALGYFSAYAVTRKHVVVQY